ncbi:protein RMD5 homolog isoform X2 [Physcomitrium patens]|uniref:protein RMD5 homolog isoform X2 n=1 Tax=Physcomitrium patens TaxID=3218 RepID=UPI003CCD0911
MEWNFFEARLKEIGAQSFTEAPLKEINNAMTKCGKLIDKCFNRNLGKVYRNVEFNHGLVNQLVALHFYRQGLFDVGDCFVAESHGESALSMRTQFWESHQILAQLQAGDLSGALAWAQEHHIALQQRKSSLEFRLQRLQFVQYLVEGKKALALEHARSSFGGFANNHMHEIQRLMGSLLWAGRLQMSPYVDILSNMDWDAIAFEFMHECCAMLGQSYNSPLFVTLCAGSQALPTLLKVAAVMGGKKHEWQSMAQLPMEIELEKGLQFHSIFACPVSRDQSTNENPPMLLPCGHVLCRQSIQKLAKAPTRTFKCPYCPSETTLSLCQQLHL